MLRLHVVFAVDRAGLVGEDGETHHGVFDVGFLRQAQGMTVLCPASKAELKQMLQWAVLEQKGPVAIRYPRGTEKDYTACAWKGGTEPLESGCLEVHKTGESVTLITYGTLLQNAMDAAALLGAEGVDTGVIRLLTVAPLPIDQLARLLPRNSHVVVLEETCTGGGIQEALICQLSQRRKDCIFNSIDLGHRYVTHGNIEALYQHCGLDAQSVARFVQEVRQLENKKET